MKILGEIVIVFAVAAGTALLAGNAIVYLVRRGRLPWDGDLR